jgi:hypothetical protein
MTELICGGCQLGPNGIKHPTEGTSGPERWQAEGTGLGVVRLVGEPRNGRETAEAVGLAGLQRGISLKRGVNEGLRMLALSAYHIFSHP